MDLQVFCACNRKYNKLNIWSDPDQNCNLQAVSKARRPSVVTFFTISTRKTKVGNILNTIIDKYKANVKLLFNN